MLRAIIYILIVFITNTSIAQFAPPAGISGSTAIHKDSSAFVDWANSCVLNRGLKNIARPDSGYVNVGNETGGIGKAGDADLVSLGDGGFAILTFSSPIYNGNGYDFAVFENSFDGQFLELAHVEVSSDGQNYHRFNSVSNTDTLNQINSFGLMDATKINNLAGKYKANYGTPFDLDELKNIVGLDIMNITHVKIIDVIGSINSLYCSRDAEGNPINDPWPTEFGSGGFDLDGVGVINSVGNSVKQINDEIITVYPTIVNKGSQIKINTNFQTTAYLVNNLGIKYDLTVNEKSILIPQNLSVGIYTLMTIGSQANSVTDFRIIIKD